MYALTFFYTKKWNSNEYKYRELSIIDVSLNIIFVITVSNPKRASLPLQFQNADIAVFQLPLHDSQPWPRHSYTYLYNRALITRRLEAVVSAQITVPRTKVPCVPNHIARPEASASQPQLTSVPCNYNSSSKQNPSKFLSSLPKHLGALLD